MEGKEFMGNLVALTKIQKEIQFKLSRFDAKRIKFRQDLKHAQSNQCKRILRNEHNVALIKKDAEDRKLKES